MRKAIATAIIMLASYSAQAGIISIGNLDFDESAFADKLGNTTGGPIRTFQTAGLGDYPVDVISVEESITDFDRGSGPFCVSCTIEVLFTDNVAVNGTGDDLLVFEQGLLEPLDLIINGFSKTYATTDAVTNPTIIDVGTGNLFSLYYIDLADFGVANGDSINAVTFDLFFVPGNAFGSSDPTLLVALNSTKVPEPSIIALFGLGLLGLGFARRRKHN